MAAAHEALIVREQVRVRAVARAWGVVVVALLLASCSAATIAPVERTTERPVTAFIDSLEQRTFTYFWETSNSRNGMVPDRWPNPPFASIAAVGFALAAYPVGVERQWITRDQAAERTLTTLVFMWRLPQGSEPVGTAGDRGFFYHFLNMETGLRHQTTELSTIDTGLLMAGVLVAQQYFDRADTREAAIRAYADSLYRRVDWPYFQRSLSPLITMAWRPERGGFGPHAYRGYDEAMIMYLLALGSPTHPIGPDAWTAFTSTYVWADFHGYEHVNFPPLFGHQYSHMFVDFRGIFDPYMRERGVDYFENSRRATLAQRQYAIANPAGWRDYGADIWGLTASDGPTDTTVVIDGVSRRFRTYWARGAGQQHINDDGTIAPTAAGGSVPFAPDETMRALQAMRERYGDDLYTRYGFLDAFNPTLRDTTIRLRRGRTVAGKGWFDDNYLGIDQGPIVVMIENHRTGLIWELMKRNPYIVRGLCRAGFTGGWIAGRCN